MKILKFLLLLLIMVLLTGCYNKEELDNYAYVVGIGADIGSGDNLNITYQIAIPLKLAGEDNSSSGKETYTTYTVSAPSLYIANELVNTTASKKVNLSHIKIILYSEELAKSDLSGHINSLISNIDIRPKTDVAICRGKAETFLKEIEPVLESSPARYYDLILESYHYSSSIADTDLLTFYTSAESIDREAYAIITELDGKEAKFSGLAVFNGGKMVGEIPPDLVSSHLILTNNLEETFISVDDIETPDKQVSLLINQTNNSKVTVKVKDNKPYINIEVRLGAHLMSSASTTDYLKKENKAKLEKEIEEHIKELILNYSKLIAQLGSDIAGFGKYAKLNYLTWEEFENINWENIFKNSIFDIKVNVDLNVSQIVVHSLQNS